jgi:hypothetical protein
MATLEIVVTDCAEPKCRARATRRLKDEDGKEVGTYCAIHGNRELVRLAKAKEEGGRGK